MHSDRIQTLRESERDGGSYVLYWMQQSQRVEANPALEWAIRRANERDLPVAVVFALDVSYPEANARHFQFLLEGLRDVDDALAERGLRLYTLLGSPPEVVAQVAGDAALVVCDRGVLRTQRRWYRDICRRLDCEVQQVEGDVVVPVQQVSDKAEYAARTIRPKLHDLLDQYVETWTVTEPARSGRALELSTGRLELIDVKTTDASDLDVDQSVEPVRRFRGGTSEARRRLTRFLRSDLGDYPDRRSEPGQWIVSTLSPYLHFGHIAPTEILQKARRSKAADEATEAFVEELVVRRELAWNFVFYTDDYDSFSCLPDWARTTLEEHENDERPHRYTKGELEAAATHDEHWNAAMREMKATGYMHNTMRMYWAKRILAWTNTPSYGYRVTLELNNKYFLDGRDPNSYANVAWTYGLHDRAWQERDVFGKVRTMTAGGLDRKYDMDRYHQHVDDLVDEEQSG